VKRRKHSVLRYSPLRLGFAEPPLPTSWGEEKDGATSIDASYNLNYPPRQPASENTSLGIRQYHHGSV
ncbi:hypothetical protein, partial [Mesorhizobium sp.]|uniref:hypothetical protein n=1 Tax=Mesorhizobium sp. TaxID=1871066 RepID=UPI0025DFBA74